MRNEVLAESKEKIPDVDGEFVEDDDMPDDIPLVLVIVKGGVATVLTSADAVVTLIVDLDDILLNGDQAVPEEAEYWRDWFSELDEELDWALVLYDEGIDEWPADDFEFPTPDEGEEG